MARLDASPSPLLLKLVREIEEEEIESSRGFKLAYELERERTLRLSAETQLAEKDKQLQAALIRIKELEKEIAAVMCIISAYSVSTEPTHESKDSVAGQSAAGEVEEKIKVIDEVVAQQSSSKPQGDDEVTEQITKVSSATEVHVVRAITRTVSTGSMTSTGSVNAVKSTTNATTATTQQYAVSVAEFLASPSFLEAIKKTKSGGSSPTTPTTPSTPSTPCTPSTPSSSHCDHPIQKSPSRNDTSAMLASSSSSSLLGASITQASPTTGKKNRKSMSPKQKVNFSEKKKQKEERRKEKEDKKQKEKEERERKEREKREEKEKKEREEKERKEKEEKERKEKKREDKDKKGKEKKEGKLKKSRSKSKEITKRDEDDRIPEELHADKDKAELSSPPKGKETAIQSKVAAWAGVDVATIAEDEPVPLPNRIPLRRRASSALPSHFGIEHDSGATSSDDEKPKGNLLKRLSRIFSTDQIQSSLQSQYRSAASIAATNSYHAFEDDFIKHDDDFEEPTDRPSTTREGSPDTFSPRTEEEKKKRRGWGLRRKDKDEKEEKKQSEEKKLKKEEKKKTKKEDKKDKKKGPDTSRSTTQEELSKDQNKDEIFSLFLKSIAKDDSKDAARGRLGDNSDSYDSDTDRSARELKKVEEKPSPLSSEKSKTEDDCHHANESTPDNKKEEEETKPKDKENTTQKNEEEKCNKSTTAIEPKEHHDKSIETKEQEQVEQIKIEKQKSPQEEEKKKEGGEKKKEEEEKKESKVEQEHQGQGQEEREQNKKCETIAKEENGVKKEEEEEKEKEKEKETQTTTKLSVIEGREGNVEQKKEPRSLDEWELPSVPAENNLLHKQTDVKENSEEDKPERMRKRAIEELITTEKDYVRDLEIVANYFLKPIKEQGILNKKDIGAIFNNIEVLLNINHSLLNDLQASFQSSGKSIGAVFLKSASFLKSYTPYIANQTDCLKVYEKAKKKNKVFSKFLLEVEANPECRGLSLMSYLIKPIQRVLKYPLILKEILSHTVEGHIEFEELSSAYKQLQEIAAHVNERQRESENKARIMDIAHRLSGIKIEEIITPTRYYVDEASFIKVSKGKPQWRHFFLFNDLLLYGKVVDKEKGIHSYRGQIPLDLILCNDIPATADQKKDIFPFEICRLDHKKKKYVIWCNSQHDKEIWIQQIMKYHDQTLASKLDAEKRNVQPKEITKGMRKSLSSSSAMSSPSASPETRRKDKGKKDSPKTMISSAAVSVSASAPLLVTEIRASVMSQTPQ